MTQELAAIGAQIAVARKRAQLTQQALGDAAHLSRQTIAALERGTVPDLGVRKLLRVLEALDLTLVTRPRGHPVTLDDLKA
jgi:transcriptional regulator with XRE-family HTH domain